MRQIMLATPKLRGFKSNKPKFETVSLAAVAKQFGAGEAITPAALKQKGMVSTVRNGVKVLGGMKAKLDKKLSVSGCAVTASARKTIEEAGGEVK
jgi:large subunit ribosomal protein L15